MLAADTDLAETLRGAKDALAHIPELRSLMLTGSIPMGAFSKAMSDIDLVGVTSQPVTELANPVRKAFGSIAGPYAEKLGVMLLDQATVESGTARGIVLNAADPQAMQECEPHEIDLVMLRKYSALMFGIDFRSHLPKLEEPDVIDDIIGYVVDRLLQRAGESRPISSDKITNLVFVMSRCLYTLANGTLATKPEAARWLMDRVGGTESLRALADLAGEFSQWYQHGLPENRDEARLADRFAEAVRFYPAAVDNIRMTYGHSRDVD